MRRNLGIALACLAALGAAAVYADKEEPSAARELASVNIEYQGTKAWVPATFIAYKGEKVRIKLTNKTPSGKHGFAISEFGVKLEVAEDAPQTAEFTASEAGLFRIYCHLHPAHIGGQLLVLEKK